MKTEPTIGILQSEATEIQDYHRQSSIGNICESLQEREVDTTRVQQSKKDHVYAVSDDQGELLELYRYTAFGEPVVYSAQTQNKFVGSVIENPVLWNSRRYDEQTDLYYYKYRHYKADIGRWLGRDPIEEDGGNNLYVNVNNNPIDYWDRLGLKPHDISERPDLSNIFDKEKLAAEAAENKAKHLGQAWDKKNKATIDKVSKQSKKIFNWGFSGMEYCGRICRKRYSKKFQIYFYKYTGPVEGGHPKDVFESNKKKRNDWLKKTDEIKKQNANLPEGGKPTSLPQEPQYAGGSCQPLDAPKCSTLGKGWKEYSYYHSHPTSNGFSEADEDFAKHMTEHLGGEKGSLWVTRGSRGKPNEWITEKTK